MPPALTTSFRALLPALFLLPAALPGQSAVTWAEHIAPIVYNKCGTCHRPGAIAPFSLLTYQEAFDNRWALQYVTAERIMPPWPPDQSYRAMAHDRSLTAGEIARIDAWVNAGAPEGNPGLAPPVPNYNVAPFGTPGLVLPVPHYTVTATEDSYRRFVVHNPFNEDRFFTLLEATPGNRAIVHHILVYEDTTGQAAVLDAQSPDEPGYDAFTSGAPQGRLIGGWVPGQSPIALPDGMGIRLRAGADLMVEIHYPAGTTGQQDSSSLAFYFTATPPALTREVFLDSPINYFSPTWLQWITGSSIEPWPLHIPANEVVTARATYNIPWFANVSVLQVAPHMHFIATSTKTYAVTPAGDTIPIIHIPHWDFHWQGFYTLPRMLPVPGGSQLVCETVYDNTVNNEHNPSFPPIDVSGGEATNDEMLLVYFAYAFYLPGDENIVLADSTVAPLVGLRPTLPRNHATLALYPNPATDHASALYYLPPGTRVQRLEVYDAAGRLATRLERDDRAEGYYSVPLPVRDYAPGLYRVVLVTDGGAVQQLLSVP